MPGTFFNLYNNQNDENNEQSAKTIVWTQDYCPLCEQVKEILGKGNYEERAASELLSGADADPEAMAQLAMQNMELPIVQIAGVFVPPNEVLRKSDAA